MTSKADTLQLETEPVAHANNTVIFTLKPRDQTFVAHYSTGNRCTENWHCSLVVEILKRPRNKPAVTGIHPKLFLIQFLSITSRFKQSARALRIANFFPSSSLLFEAGESTCSPAVTRWAARLEVGRAFGCCSVYFVKLFSRSCLFNASSLSRCCFR